MAKCWDSAPTSTGGGGTNSKNYFTIPRAEPVRPIDPGAWVAHTAAVRGESKKALYFITFEILQLGAGAISEYMDRSVCHIDKKWGDDVVCKCPCYDVSFSPHPAIASAPGHGVGYGVCMYCANVTSRSAEPSQVLWIRARFSARDALITAP